MERRGELKRPSDPTGQSIVSLTHTHTGLPYIYTSSTSCQTGYPAEDRYVIFPAIPGMYSETYLKRKNLRKEELATFARVTQDQPKKRLKKTIRLSRRGQLAARATRLVQKNWVNWFNGRSKLRKGFGRLGPAHPAPPTPLVTQTRKDRTKRRKSE